MSTQFKNASMWKNVQKVVKPEVPDLAKNDTTHKKRVWVYHMKELMKTEQVLDWNLRKLFIVLMSLCDSNTKN